MTKEEFITRVLPSEGKLFRLAVSLLADRQEAEDTLQETMLKLWNMRARLLEYDSIEALAVTMIKNLCLDKLRSYKYRKQDNTEIEQIPVSSNNLDPAEKTELEESIQSVWRALQTLPEQQRLVMHLRDIEYYSYDEMEELTGLTRNNIRVQLSRARKQVRDILIKQQNYEHRKD